MRPGALDALIPRSLSPLRPKSNPMSHHKRQPSRLFDDQENTPPLNSNIQKIQPLSDLFSPKKQQQQQAPKTPTPKAEPAVVQSPLALPSISSSNSSAAKVVVRIRPVNNTEEGRNQTVRKISPTSLSVESYQQFIYDAVFGRRSSQEDVFQLVGAPVVKDALQGFNTSILCYGETGSGKTYTMWGPLSSMLEEQTSNNSQGIAPRIFSMLFSEIQSIQQCADKTQVNFQCRCSLLEIYDGKINDLLDPTQRNLEIKEDGKSGSVYVENLSEEYVTSTEDVIQILVKGLSNRRVGATSINSKSSRSHVILTCILESWRKGTSVDSFSNSKTSKITLVDLAGLEMNAPDAASGRYKKEGRHIKGSLSSLGKAINSLSGHKDPSTNQLLRGDSCLTNLLRESLGGNAKVTFICTVSPVDSCKAGSLSTLRFGQRAKCVQNNAVVNEITEDYVNDLSDQIRQLKEELIKEKMVGTDSSSRAGGFFRRHNARGSLNRLRASLNRSLILPQVDVDADGVESTRQEDVKGLYFQINKLDSSCLEENSKDTHGNGSSIHLDENADDRSVKDSISVRESFKSVFSSEDDLSNLEDFGTDISDCDPTSKETGKGEMINESPLPVCEASSETTLRNFVAESADCPVSSVLRESVFSTSPERSCSMRKSFSKSSCSLTAEALASNVSMSFQRSQNIRSSLQFSKLSPTDALAESLHRGLQIIDRHQQRSVARSSMELSFDYLKNARQSGQSGNETAMQTSPVNDKDTGRSETAKRISELQDFCSKQEATIVELKQQVERYRQEIEQKSLVEILKPEKNETSDDQGKSNLGGDLTKYGRNELIQQIQLLRNEVNSLKNSVSSEEPELREHVQEAAKLASIESPFSPRVAQEYERERERWVEAESKWISLTEELRVDIESSKRVVEEKDVELAAEKKCSEELNDALQRALLGHGRMVEHYVELQDKYVTLLEQHRQVMDAIAEVKKAAAKAGKKSHGSAFAHALNSELSKSRAQKEKERILLKEQNTVLKMQLKDTAEAVQAAGELLVKLREAEETAVLAEEKYSAAQEEVERLKKQMEKMKNKHAMEMVTMKQYVAESRLPESAREPYYREEHEDERQGRGESSAPVQYDSQSWRTAFAPSYR